MAARKGRERFCESTRCVVFLGIIILLCVGAVVIVTFVAKGIRSKLTRSRDVSSLLWWETSIVYQVYPRSFQDTNGDGTGDLQGIISRLGHFQYLGVGAFWLSPFYKSPMVDNGYDVSDYQKVDPLFGTLSDFKQLVQQAHAKGLHILVDFVPNHTSDQHEWFRLSRANKTSKYRNYYIWSPGKVLDNGTRAPPNNWKGTAGQSAWAWDSFTEEYYYHRYLPAQPDLNLRNPQVLTELDAVLRFWLDKGVDGFRVDAVRHLFETEDVYQDEPKRNMYTRNQPDIFPVVTRWRGVLDEYESRDGRPRVLICETNGISAAQKRQYYEAGGVPFYFGLTEVKGKCGGQCVRDVIAKGLDIADENWPNFVIGSHDIWRVAERWGTGLVNAMNMLLLTLPGSPTTYYGEEIGMENVAYRHEEMKDNFALLAGKDVIISYRHTKAVVGYALPDDVDIKSISRDPERSPMQWNTSVNAGFTSGKPWLRVHPEYKTFNVQVQKGHPGSVLELYRQMSILRKTTAFKGKSIALPDTVRHLLTYVRGVGSDRYAVAINFGTKSEAPQLDTVDKGKVTLATGSLLHMVNTNVRLSDVLVKPGEGMIVKLQLED